MISALRVMKWTAVVGWPATLALVVVNPEVSSPLRLVFILLTTTVPLATFGAIVPALLGDYFAAIKLGVMLHAREVGDAPRPKDPVRLRSVV